MGYWIVVVDDEALTLTHVKSLLREQDMRVSCLRSGKDLLKFMAKNRPDLVLLDIQMPEMDGFETYQELRRMEEHAGQDPTPIIFLSGMETSEAERFSLEQGASDFIRKPVHKEILIKRIRNAVKHNRDIENLKEEAAVDKLTGFMNKGAGSGKLAKYCEERAGMLMILDLDNFKLVNDIYGHSMGDKFLMAFADVVRRNIRADDVMVRVGGDEFAGFFCNMSGEAALGNLQQRLNSQLHKEAVRLVGEDFDIPLSISIGAVLVPEHGRGYEMLFSLADSALYKVKQNGKNGSMLYCPGEEAALADDQDIQKEFARITQIVEERHSRGGAFILNLEQFSLIYRFIRRFYIRYGGRLIKLMFILSEDVTKGEYSPSLNDAAEKFGLCLQDSLRQSDMILHHKPYQFLVILQNLAEEDFPDVLRRIMAVWESGENNAGTHIEYLMESVVFEQEPSEK
ncbi:putative response regulator receiver protein [Selenomonas ruminantium subsp. lactilytica TAM6421]|uniref:Putative response regulator receiver protein n=1 Tax=Selenomonas ruminantium subsp. lactilytica (strain NBRC 103574 / TAM6421) TaxID=927704 RepID=I0GUK7_SELRL|nr:diguanylate cyclase [Selenomonas ruminantium]BAL84444.1 putative response regulator receiver protein [Selenomonas ruminantium subsp. lactilytica TAM6421]